MGSIGYEHGEEGRGDLTSHIVQALPQTQGPTAHASTPAPKEQKHVPLLAGVAVDAEDWRQRHEHEGDEDQESVVCLRDRRLRAREWGRMRCGNKQ